MRMTQTLPSMIKPPGAVLTLNHVDGRYRMYHGPCLPERAIRINRDLLDDDPERFRFCSKCGRSIKPGPDLDEAGVNG